MDPVTVVRLEGLELGDTAGPLDQPVVDGEEVVVGTEEEGLSWVAGVAFPRLPREQRCASFHRPTVGSAPATTSGAARNAPVRGCAVPGVRPHLALERLTEPGASISVVATGLGFASPSAFAHAFRRHVGETPSEYAARSRG
ncbi:MAG: helix-turn-helix transcriptional regulator [Deltaproteobacteria bacterium]|nr:helix-turn-helix transcriptional regulator [Deltaproteobacteria bacterium]